MSNSRVRRELQAQEEKNKYFNAYKKKADLLLNYQMCKAYYRDSGISVLGIAEKILKEKYNRPWQLKLIRKAMMGAKGKNNPTISIPQVKFEKNVHDILSNYVEKHFDRMMGDRKTNGMYPLKLREIIERVS